MKFEKVTLKQFTKDIKKHFPWLEDDAIEVMWKNIKLPARATAGSAGYDFYSPVSFSLDNGDTVTVPTGIRASIDNGYFLMLVPRSGLGFKYGLALSNTIGVIDVDYFNADNEGHIMAKVYSDPKCGVLNVAEGDRFMQGIFVPYAVTNDDVTSGKRAGGMGSTGVN